MVFSRAGGCNSLSDRYNGAARHMASRVVVAPSVPPQRLPVNLVRPGREQPQREHCVPGCGWWGRLHFRGLKVSLTLSATPFTCGSGCIACSVIASFLRFLLSIKVSKRPVLNRDVSYIRACLDVALGEKRV